MAKHESEIAQFIEITGVRQTEAVRLLEATNWVVEDALQLFFTIGPDGLRHYDDEEDDEPIIPEGDVRLGRARSQGTVRAETGDLDYAPPYTLLFAGSFHEAIVWAESEGKWLLANVQADESESYELNKNVWRNTEIQDIIQKHFIFWQIYDDLEEGRKINHWYKINKKPAVLIIDPHTGLKMHQVEGNVDAQRMIEFLRLYTEKGPVDGSIKHSEAKQEVRKIEYPALPREPARGTPGAVNVAIRLPYGSRVQRKFLATDPIQVLWSFASTQMTENTEFDLFCPTRRLKLNYNEKKSIQEAGVADSVLTLVLHK